MIESVLKFLTTNKEICIGAAVTVTEVLTIVINWWRKNKVAPQKITTMGKETFGQKLIWSINPVNLFRKP